MFGTRVQPDGTLEYVATDPRPTPADLPPYGSMTRCPKCECPLPVREQYRNGDSNILYHSQVNGEHIRKTCPGCGYAWHERCADQTP